MLSIHLRHRVTAGAALLASAVMLVEILPLAEAWWDDWPFAASLLGENLLQGGFPLTGAAACWLGGTDARQGTKWLSATASRPSLQRVMTQAAPAVLWPLGGYLLVVAVLGLIIPTRAYFGFVPLDAVTSDLALQTMVSCLGYALGRALPLRFTAPLFGILIYLASTDPRNPLCSGIPLSYSGHDVPGLDKLYPPTPPQWLPWLCSAAFLVLAVAVLSMCARRWLLAMLCLLVMVPAAILLVHSQERRLSQQLHNQEGWGHYPPSLPPPDSRTPQFFYRSAPDPVPLECSVSSPVCTAADTRVRLDVESADLDEIAERLDGVRGAPTDYVLTGRTSSMGQIGSLSGRDGDRWWWTVTLQNVSSATQSREESLSVSVSEFTHMLASSVPQMCSPDDWTTVYAWLTPPRFRDNAYVDIGASDAAPLERLSRTERTEWLSDYFSGSPCKPLPG